MDDIHDTKQAFHDAMYAHVTLVDDVADHLRRLASAFRMTGNSKVADDLVKIAGEIVESANAVQRAASVDLSNDVRKSEDTAYNLLQVAIITQMDRLKRVD